MANARVAVVTGCGKLNGIGAAAARALAQNGFSLAISDVTESGLSNAFSAEDERLQTDSGLSGLRADLADIGVQVNSYLCDVTNESSVVDMIASIVSEFGRLDVLINNATAPQGADRQRVDRLPSDAWDQVMDVSAKGSFLMTRAAAPHMIDGGWGRIVNIASRSATTPRTNMSAYAAAKAAVAGFTRAVALDLAPFGVTVNAVLPGPIMTTRAISTSRREFGDNIELGFAKRAKSIPVGRLGEPSEVGALVAFLASPEAAFITGSLIPIDGGI